MLKQERLGMMKGDMKGADMWVHRIAIAVQRASKAIEN